MSANPHFTIGGSSWSGNPPLATVRQLLSTSSGFEGNISTIQQQVSTLTVSSGVTLWANFAAVNNVNMAGFSMSNVRQVSTLSLNVSSINGTDININASTVGIGLVEITGSTITTGVGGTQITGGAVTTNEVKSKSYTVSDIVDAVGAAVDTVTDAGQAVSGVFGATQTAAQVATVAYGVGTIASGVSAANGVVDLATKTASLFTTRIANTISGPAGPPGQTTPVYETINGTTQFQFSTLNVASFTVFRTIDKTNPNQTFGNEIFVSTIIAPGTKCVRSVSDPLQFVIISSILISTNNYLQSYGQWFPVLAPEFNLNVSTLTADNIFTSFLSSPLINVSTLNAVKVFTSFLSSPSIVTNLINNSITITNSNLSNVGQFYANNGIFSNAIGVTANAQVGSLTSLGAVSGTSGSFSGNVGVNNLTAVGAVNGATAVFSGSIQGGSLYTPNNTVTGTLTVTTAAGMGSLSVTGTAAAATVNATTFNGTGIATFATLNGTTLNASTLNAIEISTGNILLSSFNGVDVNSILTPAVGIPDNLSTLTISTGSAVISSINGFSFASLLNPAAVTFSTASTFLQLFTSSLQASNINTISLQANQFFTSSLVASNISTNQLFTSSLVASNINNNSLLTNQLLTSSLVASNINNNSLQTNQLLTSSLVASNINTNFLQTNQLLTSSLVASNINTNFLQTTQLLTSSLQALTFSTTIANISTINLIGQINISTNLVLSDSSNFDISKTISLTSTSFSTISSFQNNILRYTYNATVDDETAFDIGPGYNLGSDNVAQWESTILLGTNENAVMTIEIDNDPSTGFLGTGTFDAQRQQLDPNNPPYDILVQYSLGGATIVDIPFNDFRIYRFTKSTAGTPVNWTYVIGPPTYQTVNNNIFQITQNLTDVTLSATDNLNINAGSIKFNGSLQLSNVNITKGFFSTINAATINTTNLTASTINSLTINSLTANTTNLNGATIRCSTLTTSNIQNADAILVQKFQGPTPLSLNALTNQYVTLSGGLSGTNGRAQTNQINFLALPGMVDAGIPPGYPNNTTLTFTAAGKSLLIGNPGFPSLWYSSITSVDNSLTTKIVNFQVPTGGNGEVVLLTNGIANVQVQSNATNFGIITTIGYSKLSWNAGVFSIVNAGSYSPYLSTMVTQDTRIQTGANNAMNLINKQTLFNGKAPVVFYQNFTGFFVGTPGSASGSGVLSYNGSNFATNQWSCYLSFYNINLAQNNLAINNFNITTTAFGSNWGAYCYTGVATAVNGATSNVNWNIQAIMVPKEFALQQNFNKFGEEAPEQDLPPSTFTSTISFFNRLELPEILVSSITASTIVFEAFENMSLLAGIPVPGYLGTGNITIAGTASVELIGDQAVVGGLTDVNIDAINGSLFLSGYQSLDIAATTINFSTSVMNFDTTTTLSNLGDFDLYAAGRIRLYSPWINIEDTSGNIINFASNVFDSFTNIGDQRIKFGTISSSNIFTIRNISGDIDLEGSNVTRTLSGVQIGQPVLQYGEASSSGNNGSVVVTLPTAYTSAASYVAFVSMMDADPAEMSVVRNTSSEIEIFWAQAGGGSHTIAWNTMGT
jgi:hypothetical protein